MNRIRVKNSCLALVLLIRSEQRDSDVSVNLDIDAELSLSLTADVVNDLVLHALDVLLKTTDLKSLVLILRRLNRCLSCQLKVANRLSIASNDETDEK